MPRRPQYDREDLIERARDIFWRQGWAGTSLKDLEAVLNMKPGSFYAAFGSKDALFELALDKYAADGAERLATLAREHGALETLKMYPGLVIENGTAATTACMLAKTVLELTAREHELATKANALLLEAEVRFAELFRAAQADGDIKATQDPKVLARRYQSDLIGLRISAERDGVDAQAIAAEISESLDRL